MVNKNIKQMKKLLSDTNAKDDTFEQLTQILSMSDDKFAKVWEISKAQIQEMFNSSDYQKELVKAYKTSDQKINIEEEKKAINELKNDIMGDDSISAEKKEFIDMMFGEIFNAITDLAVVPRERIKIKIQKTKENAILPAYANPTDAGADVYLAEDITLKPHETAIASTGVAIEVPVGYIAFLYPRSGVSAKTKIRIANSVGVIDPEYHKEIGVILDNTGNLTQEFKAGDRIGQLIVMPAPMIEWEEVDEIDKTNRDGFGSTGS